MSKNIFLDYTSLYVYIYNGGGTIIGNLFELLGTSFLKTITKIVNNNKD